MAGATVVSSSSPRRQNSTQWARWIEALARALQPASGRVDQIRSASGHRSDKRPPMSTIISAVLTVGLSRPVYPQLQTCRCTALTDAMCQERTSRHRSNFINLFREPLICSALSKSWTRYSMTTLRIYDLRDGRVLALDLRDLIDLLAPRSLESSWTVSPVSVEYPTLGRTFDEFMVTGQGGDQLESLAASGSLVSGLILAEYAHATHQVIWG